MNILSLSKIKYHVNQDGLAFPKNQLFTASFELRAIIDSLLVGFWKDTTKLGREPRHQVFIDQ